MSPALLMAIEEDVGGAGEVVHLGEKYRSPREGLRELRVIAKFMEIGPELNEPLTFL
jgi:hypothetical protein